MSPLDHPRELAFMGLCPSRMPCSPVMRRDYIGSGAAVKWFYIKRLVKSRAKANRTENGCSDQPEKVAAFAFLYGSSRFPGKQAIVAQAAIPKFLEPDADVLMTRSRPSSELRETVRAVLMLAGQKDWLRIFIRGMPSCNELVVQGYDTVCLV
jgi:hypothetical protein